MTRIEYDPRAIADINSAREFYDGIDGGLGDYFLSSLVADIARLRVTAGVHRIVLRYFHRAVCRDFPYGIFYTVEKGVAVVWAVVDLRRDTEWIKEHLATLRP